MDHSFSRLRTVVIVLALALCTPVAMGQPLPKEPKEGKTPPLSSAEVSDAEIESAAEVIVSMEMQRAQLEKKYGEPEDMTTEQRRKAQREIMRERQLLMQQKTVAEDLDAGRLELIMVSARRDSVMHERVQAAMDKKRAEKRKKGASKQ
jgi:hypothetical protein